MSEEEGGDHQHQQQQRHFRHEREARSLALEKAYVHDVYAQIAPHFARHRSKAWPRVCQFLLDLEPGSLVCDVGCGNGKYLGVNRDVFTLGSDRCRQLTDIARQQHHEVVVCDNLHVPFRDESFDAALSVAVIHHLATTERRVQALRELARILRLGGRLMISVWAMEQRHRRFESQDVLVPWHKPVESSSEEQASHADGELTSTTTSDDDLLNYHAHSQLDSDSCYVPSRYGRRRHRLRSSRGHCPSRVLDGACPSSSQSSSDLSSPNETCYSFVRRALAKFSSSTRSSWDDPRQRCRPWFVPSPPTPHQSPTTHAPLENQDSAESVENAADLPIELRDVDAPPSESDSPPNSPRKAVRQPVHLNQKSKSLSDLLSLLTAGLLRGPGSRKGSNESNEHKKSKQKPGLGRSKSSHTHLTRVEENTAESTNANKTSVTPRHQRAHSRTPSTEQCKRPRSLIILNADDHRNGNTILPDIDGETESNAVNKRASWPVVPKRLSILQTEFPPLHADAQGQNQTDSGVEDLYNGGNGNQVERASIKNKSSALDGKSRPHPPIRLKRQLIKQMDNVDLSDTDETVRDFVCERIIRQMMAQAKLFPSHSMPDLHAPSRFFFTNKSHRSLTIAPVLIRNGFKGRSNFRRKESLGLIGGIPNGYYLVKRSLSLDYSGTNERVFEPRERVYCNRITKEDSLQRDTSYDSDDSVASVIAVPPKDQGGTSDTSLDSEDSCISVIAMPIKETNLILAPPPDVLQTTATNITPTTPATDAPDVLNALSPLAAQNDLETQNGLCLPDVVCSQKMSEEIPADVTDDDRVSSGIVVNVTRFHDRVNIPLSRCSSEGADDVTSDVCADRKVLRKAGSLPEHGDQRQNGSGLLTQPAVALSASADLTLGAKGVDRALVADWNLSGGGSLSSSRSSSNSSICWEKFLDASRSVVLDNIAMVSAGSDVVLRSGKGSVAILKNASHRSHVLHEYTKQAAKREAAAAEDFHSENSGEEKSADGTLSPALGEKSARVASSLREAMRVTETAHTHDEENPRDDVNRADEPDDVEYKEASVQTSLILYSTQEENRAKRNSKHEDVLNGNLLPTPDNKNDLLTSTCSSIDNHFGNLEFIKDPEEAGQKATATSERGAEGGGESKCLNRERSLSVSTSDESLQCAGEVGGSLTFHRYYHVFREGELDQLIEKYVENLHIISSYYDHANWCVIAEKVQVWRI